MKTVTIIVATIIILFNVVFGFVLTDYTWFNVCFTSIVVIMNTILLCLLDGIKLKTAFSSALYILFSFCAFAEFTLGCLSPEQFENNWYLVSALIIFVSESILLTLSKYISKSII